MTEGFVHDTPEQRVISATGRSTEALAAEVKRFNAGRVVVVAAIAERHLADAVIGELPAVGWVDEVRQHVPIESAERAREFVRDADGDLLVSIGGGSTTGMAKAIALTTGIPIVAVPTTYAGSEATDIWGVTEGARKTTGTDRRVLPRTVIYDAALTYSLPRDVSVASGFNAIAHCVDSLWAPRADPINSALVAEGIRAMRDGLLRIDTDPHDRLGRERAQLGAYLSAVGFASAGSGIHHKICHVLGGMFDLPHAEMHTVVLPYVVALNAPMGSTADIRLAGALDAESAVAGLRDLQRALAAPQNLRDLGMPANGIEEAAAVALPLVPPNNPHPVSVDVLAGLIRAAWSGSDPSTWME